MNKSSGILVIKKAQHCNVKQKYTGMFEKYIHLVIQGQQKC